VTPEPITPTQWGSDPEFFGPRHAVREAMMLKELTRRLPAPARVLDAGAGSASFARRLAGAGYAVVAIETSEAFLAYARSRPHPGLTVEPGDITRIPFEDAAFDGAVAGEVLEHLQDHHQAVRELHRVLRPGGLCLITVPADPHQWDLSDEWAGHVRRYSAPELQALFARHGFTVERHYSWGFPVTRLYHRKLYLPMLARKIGAPETGPTRPLTGWKKLASGALAALMRLDHLFDGSPWGIGYVLVARKH
jgi:SAM-dependent methyltransferase